MIRKSNNGENQYFGKPVKGKISKGECSKGENQLRKKLEQGENQ